ncbi:MAG: hypothetical protein RIA63_08540, partial [Cyclobacteriaceae bacterium]
FSQQKSVKDRVTNLAEYAEVNVSSDSLAQWVEWVKTGESLNEEVPTRNEAWRKFMLSFYRHQGTIPDASVNEQSLQAWSQFLTFPFLTGRILDFKSVGRNDIPLDEIMSKSGEGSRHVILIPPFGFTSEVFEVFKSRYKEDFTFHEISFPNGNKTWKYPEKANYTEAEWLTKTENAITSYLEKLGKTELIIVGLGTGSYTAFKLAKNFPNIKAIVSINGQYKSDLINISETKDSDPTYRKSVSYKAFPTSLIIQFSPGVLARNYALTADPIKNQKYLDQITPDNVNAILRYNQEFKAQDITSLVVENKAPILSIVSLHNDQSSQVDDRSVGRLWQELHVKNPNIPLSVVKIPESQNLVFI